MSSIGDENCVAVDMKKLSKSNPSVVSSALISTMQRLLRRVLEDMKDASKGFRLRTRRCCLTFLRNLRNIDGVSHKIPTSYFEMLKAFEPPLDMSVDIDSSKDQTIDNASNNCLLSSEMNLLPCQSGSKLDFSKAGEFSYREGGIGAHRSFKPEIVSEEKKIDNSNSGCNGKVDHADANGFQSLKTSPWLSSTFDCDGHASSLPDWLDPSLQLPVPLADVDKGQREREECYKPILNELERLFPHRSRDGRPACLVPGAGLGRLALEISCLDFLSQGNEFSYYMMICSSFILNHCHIAEEWTIYPWIHSNCNSLSDNDQLRPASFPDIHPASAGITEGFSMCGGDFVEVYSCPSQVGVWDAVATCFFLDTAHNIVEYIEIISRILKEGGVWINLGPLLYHFADSYNQEDEMSIELSLEDVKRVACHYGFEIEKESTISTTYTSNVRSMMQNRYYAAFWTMRKKPLGGRSAQEAVIVV